MVRRLEEKFGSVKAPAGSALVLVIVITVILATVGVMFVMMSRVSQTATSAISDSRELVGAVDMVVNRIQTVLVNDLFGSDANMFNGPGDSTGQPDEYYDYPGPDDPWLANLEPVQVSGQATPDPCDDIYGWLQVSNIVPDICIAMGLPVNWPLIAEIAEPSDANDFWKLDGIADADGDGVTDSRWVRLPVTSSKGKPIFVAARIIDNCGMININTAYRDPTDPCNPGSETDWDGSLLTHINLETDRNVHDLPGGVYYGFLSYTDRLNELSTQNLHMTRCGGVPISDPCYHNDVSRRLLNPDVSIVPYVPFDIGDELEFRNRFFLSTTFIPPGVVTRSGLVWPATLDPQANPGRGTPFGTRPTDTIRDWFLKVTSPEILSDPCDRRICNRRHITTTYSFDRIIRPYDDTLLPDSMLPTPGRGKFGIQLPTVITNQYIRRLAGAIYRGLPGDSEIADDFGAGYTREKLAWQFAVNLIDYQDNDGDPCNPDDDEPTYYKATLDDNSVVKFWGVENRECIKNDTIFVSQVAYINFVGTPLIPAGNYYAIELLNPNTAAKDLTLNDYTIAVESFGNISLNAVLGNAFPSNDVVVLTNDKINATTVFAGRIFNDPSKIYEVTGLSFDADDEIVAYKKDWPTAGIDMPVDRIKVPLGVVDADGAIHTSERNKTLGPPAVGPKVHKLLWTNFSLESGELGTATGLSESDPNVQLFVPNENLRTIAEIENVFAVGYNDPNDNSADKVHTLIGDIRTCSVLYSINELGSDMGRYGRISLADTSYRPLLDFLTCFDPSSDGVDNNGDGLVDEPTELAVAGRININTAPWFVIKHLPWVGLTNAGLDTDNLAQAIVAWRDKLNLATLTEPTLPNYSGPNGRANATNLTDVSKEVGFRGIGELLQVINKDMTSPEFDIRKYLDGVNNGPSPVSPDYTGDITDDDFEERDIIFQRISNLVTVRSDVFTAYILVRIDHDGPQKRMIAIFDRSNVFSPADKPRLVALHPVPDPR